MKKEQIEDFNKIFITSSEICKNFNVSRSTLQKARERGLLPKPCIAPGIRAYFWRRDEVKKFLDAWEITLKAKRGQLVR